MPVSVISSDWDAVLILTSTGLGSSGSTGGADDAGGGGADDGVLLGAGAVLDGALDGVALLAVAVVFPPPDGLVVGVVLVWWESTILSWALLLSTGASNSVSDSVPLVLLLSSMSDEGKELDMSLDRVLLWGMERIEISSMGMPDGCAVK